MMDMRMYSILLLAAALASGQGRLRPPENVGCDRNQLTSYQGEVKSYSRTARQITLAIHTDENTNERVVLSRSGRQTFESRFLWNGEKFEAKHWKDLEESPEKLRPGIRVIAWVCTGGGAPLLDWRPAPR